MTSTSTEIILTVEGFTTLPAPAATLLVTPVAAGGVALEPLVISTTLDLAAFERFTESVAIPVTAGIAFEGALVRLTYDAAPMYYLNRELRVSFGGYGINLVELVIPTEVPVLPTEVADILATTEATLPPIDDNGTALPGEVTAAATTTVHGILQFTYNGNTVPCRYCKIEVWDDDVWPNADDPLGNFETSSTGEWWATNVNNDDTGGSDVYVKAITTPNRVLIGKVVDTSNNLYSHQTDVMKTDCPNTNCEVGTYTMGPTGNTLAAHWVYQNVAKSWDVVRYQGPNIVLAFAEVRYPVDGWCTNIGGDGGACHPSGTLAHYHVGTETNAPQAGVLHIPTGDVASEDILVHEHGHHVMFNGYNPTLPATWWLPPDGSPNCPSPHFLNGDSNRECAWVEGWGDFWPSEVHDSPRYDNPDGSWINWESWTCSPSGESCGSAGGDDVEGRVAATLWDLRDTTNDGESISYTLAQLWSAFVCNGGDDAVLTDFRTSWSCAGHSDTNFKTVANLNTMNYT